MKDFDLNDLNNEQQQALENTEGAVLVTAGAGSGKTRLLTYRIAHLIKDKQVPASNILAITFTNKAAKEMLTRLSNMVEDADKLWVSTFHAMCSKILRKNIVALQNKINLKRETEYRKGFDSNFSIYTDSDKDKTLKEVCAKLGVTDEKIISKAEWHISNAKNNNLKPLEYQRLYQYTQDIDLYMKIYSAYQVSLENNNALDFDDLLTKTYELFVTCPDVLDFYQNKFQYIHVDEFQDTNTVQYHIVRLLAGKNGNIFVVGDEDQCIYGWRGANISNILDFRKDFPTCRSYKLERNYRSTKQILTTANTLIKNNLTRNDKVLWTQNEEGVRVEHYQSQDETAEAEYIASTVYNLVKYSNYKYSDIAILMRLNALTRPFEEKFLNYNIPHRIFGGFKFYERQEIKNILAYMRLLVNPQDSAALYRVINFPKRGIGQTTIDELSKQADYNSVSPLELLLNNEEYMLSDSITKKFDLFKNLYLSLLHAYQTLPPVDFVKQLLKETKIKESYNSSNEEDLSKLMNIDAFVNTVQEYFDQNPTHKLEDYLQTVTLTSDIDSYDDENNCVTLATVHSVKGLEFKVVFIVGLEEKIFPLSRATTASELEEERRLMYVAITRAEQRLYLTHTRTRFMYGKRDYMLESRFLKEMGVVKEQVSTSMSFETKSSDYNFNSYGAGRTSFSLPKVNQSKNSNLAEYQVGVKVQHPKFGSGTITNIDSLNSTKCVTIEFADFGSKTLSVEYAPITIVK